MSTYSASGERILQVADPKLLESVPVQYDLGMSEVYIGLFVEKVSLEPHERHSISGRKLQVLLHSCCSQPTQATSDRRVEYVRH